MSSKDKNIEKTEPGTALDKKSSENKDSRRNLLKKLAVGGIAGAALPTKWSKPVIDAVVLPAHAQTSDDTVVGGGGGGGGPGPAPANSLGEEVLDFFTSPASAGPGTPVMVYIDSYCLELTIAQTNSTPTKVTVTKMCYNHCFNPALYPDKLRDRNIGATELTGSGSNWSGMVDGIQLDLSNVDPSSNTLANSSYAGMPGTIFRDTTCNCPCST